MHIRAVDQVFDGLCYCRHGIVRIHDSAPIIEVHEGLAFRAGDRFCRPDIFEELRGG